MLTYSTGGMRRSVSCNSSRANNSALKTRNLQNRRYISTCVLVLFIFFLSNMVAGPCGALQDGCLLQQHDGAAAPIKPQSDKLQYRFITLPNGLKALLVSDPETDKAAASLDVSVPTTRRLRHGRDAQPQLLQAHAHVHAALWRSSSFGPSMLVKA